MNEDEINTKTTVPKKEEFKLNFDNSEYNFTLFGAIKLNEYIGTTRLMNISDENLLRQISYSLEDGINGFVEIDPINGHLSVGEKLLQDSYEQIRFSVFANRNQQLEVIF